MTVLGAVGGAVAGHQAEKQVRATTSHLVDVRMENGTTRTIDVGTAPGPVVGTRVRIVNGQLSTRTD
jgi:outer membrane lipoprotein SlyB